MKKKKIFDSKKLSGLLNEEKVFLYFPQSKWYLGNIFKTTEIHKILKYRSGNYFKWISEIVLAATRKEDSYSVKKQIDDKWQQRDLNPQPLDIHANYRV